MTSDAPTPARSYAGMSAQDRVAERRARLLEAALELMGTRGASAPTVRGVAEESGVAARYVYESFGSVEALHLAVFDAIAAESAERAIAALMAVPDHGDDASRTARVRAVLAAMADLMLEDPRKGRVVLQEAVSSPVLGPRLLEESRRFAAMLAATASVGDPLAPSADLPAGLRLTAHFLIGGVAHAFAAVLEGDVDVDREELVDVLVELFLTVDARIVELAT